MTTLADDSLALTMQAFGIDGCCSRIECNIVRQIVAEWCCQR